MLGDPSANGCCSEAINDAGSRKMMAVVAHGQQR